MAKPYTKRTVEERFLREKLKLERSEAFLNRLNDQIGKQRKKVSNLQNRLVPPPTPNV
jgi:hypothetical protein